jgi:hypothetical protein
MTDKWNAYQRAYQDTVPGSVKAEKIMKDWIAHWETMPECERLRVATQKLQELDAACKKQRTIEDLLA